MDPELCVVVRRASSDLGPRGPELFTRRDSTLGLPDEESALRQQEEEETVSHVSSSHTEQHRGKSSHHHEHKDGDGHHDEHHHHHHETPRHQRPFYKPPRALYQWGVRREDRHVQSSQLYFDLLYVGVSFRSGSLLGEHLSGENVLIFLATILLMYGAWYSRLSFDAMLKFEDNFHSLIFLVQALLLVLAAHQLTEVSELQDYSGGQALGFTVCMIVNHLLILGIWLELYIFEKEHIYAKKYALIAVCMETVPVILLIVSMILILCDQSLVAVAVVWLLAYLASRVAWQTLLLSKGLTKENSIPWDVGFCILRFGQFTMLMLGEGVLQIIIFAGLDRDEDVPRSTVQWIALFFLSYAMMGMLQLLHFTTLPFNENDHILLRGPRIVATLWIESFGTYSCALVACGVALKKQLYLQEKLYPDLEIVDDVEEAEYEAYKYSHNREKYFWFLGASLAVATFLLAVQQILQVDISQELGIFVNWTRPKNCDDDSGMGLGSSEYDNSTDSSDGNLTPNKEQLAAKNGDIEAPASPGTSNQPESNTVNGQTIQQRPKLNVRTAKKCRARRRIQFGHGHEKKRIWFLRLVVVPCSFLCLGTSKHLDPVYIILIADLMLLGLLIFDIVRGRFKRKRKLNRTVAAIIAIGKLKRFVRLRREQRERERLLQEQDSMSNVLDEENEVIKVTPVERSDSSSSTNSRRNSGFGRMVRTLSNASNESLHVLRKRLSSGINGSSRRNYVPSRSLYKTCFRVVKSVMFETAFYRPFLPRLDWNNLHAAHEMEWQNLFYDLTIVALAYRLNHVDFSDLSNFSFSTLVLYIFEASAVLDCWNKHNLLQATFVTGDVFHRVVTLVQFGLVGFLSSEVLVRVQLEATSERFIVYMYTFASVKLLFEVILIAQSLEIWFTYRRSHAQARGSARRMIMSSAITIALLICSFVTAWHEVNVLVTVFLWGAGHYLSYIVLFFEVLIGQIHNESTLPVDIGFVAHRESELGLIMIGEGILSIINADVVQAVRYYGNFVLGFAVISATKTNYFFIQRFTPATMAARTSRYRGIIVSFLMPIFMIALSAVGGITVWAFVEDPGFVTTVYHEYAFCAIPLTVVMGLLCFFDLMHEGPEEIYFLSRLPITFLAIYVFKAFLVASPFLIVWGMMDSSAMLGVMLVVLVVLFFTHGLHLDKRAYLRHLRETEEDQRLAAEGTAAALQMKRDKENAEAFHATSAQRDCTKYNAEERYLAAEEEAEDAVDDVIDESVGREIALG